MKFPIPLLSLVLIIFINEKLIQIYFFSIIEYCIVGCRPIDQIKCGDGYRWRDEKTCVKEEDCTCRSFNGEMIKVIL